MTSGGFLLRAAEPDDLDEVEALGALSADGGAVAFRIHTHVRAEGPGLTRSAGVVAVDEGDGTLVGSARMTLGRCWYEGAERSYAVLGSLVVHPERRRRGIGAALGRWRIERAEQLVGADVVVLADIQKGNAGSLAAARRWASAFVGPSSSVPVPMRSRRVRPPRGLEIRAASPEQLPEIADRVTAATADCNFARVWTPSALRQWLEWAPTGIPVHHYRLAISPSGAVLAGLALRQEGLLRSMEVVRMPPAIRLANSVLHVVPRDGILRNIGVEHIWYLPGQERAAAALWDDTRWSFRDRGSGLLLTVDRRSPLRSVLGVRPWMPATSIMTAVRADPSPSPKRLIAPPE